MDKDEKTSGKRILEIIRSGLPPEAIGAALDGLDHTELLHAVLTLKDENQRELLAALTPHRAATLVEEFPDSHTAELIEDMPVGDVASIVEELSSDHRADVLAELDKDDAEAIIAELDEEDANEVRELISYPPDQAGGLMMT